MHPATKKALAFHEGAHAICGASLGLAFVRIAVLSEDKASTIFRKPKSPTPDEQQRFLITFVAGHAAERHFLPHKIWGLFPEGKRWEEGTDGYEVDRIVNKICPRKPHEAVREAESQAITILSENIAEYLFVVQAFERGEEIDAQHVAFKSLKRCDPDLPTVRKALEDATAGRRIFN